MAHSHHTSHTPFSHSFMVLSVWTDMGCEKMSPTLRQKLKGLKNVKKNLNRIAKFQAKQAAKSEVAAMHNLTTNYTR